MTKPDLKDAFCSFRTRLPRQARLFVGAGTAEPIALGRLMEEDGELAEGIRFIGIRIPGINRFDWAGLHPTCSAETIFLSPDFRKTFEDGRTKLVPLTYSQAWHWLGFTPLDGAVIMVSEPDRTGHVSLGISPDFAPAVLNRTGLPAMAIINPGMPAPPDSIRVPLDRFALHVRDECPLIEIAPVCLPDEFALIAEHVNAQINEGDTLQFGLGNLQQAVLDRLASRRRLSIHSGMISDPVQSLLDNEPSISITTGIAVGTNAFYQRLATARNIRFRPVCETHMPERLAQIPRFTAINSLIEVDLFGQANAEFINTRQISGTGGLSDFLRGARLSPGGRAITALMSTASGGRISRIVPHLREGSVSIPRTDLDIIVTEHGTARLSGLDIDSRAEALINLAAPSFRPMLASEWAAMRRRM